MSPEFERVTGIPIDAALEDPNCWLALVPEHERAAVMDGWLVDADGRPHEEEFHLLRPDGSLRLFQRRSFPINGPDGWPYRVATVAEDITERRKVEEQYRQAQKMEAVGQLAAGVAHDFNNILAAIVMQADLAAFESAHGTPAEYLAEIKAAAQRGATLTRQLLLFSRKEVLRPQLIDLNDAVGSIAKMLRRVLPESIRLEIAYETEPLMLLADGGMLDQVILNLVVNARDAMPAGGTLRVTVGKVTVTHPDRGERAPGEYVTLTVHDEGTGIAPDVLPHIFDPFFTTKGEGRGTGLGLATVFGIVRQHRGWVDVQTEIGKGTRFVISLPQAAATGESPAAQPAFPLVEAKLERAVLLVEDESAVRTATRRILEQNGLRVLDAADAREAFELFARHSETIGMLITDLGLPGHTSGQVLADSIRSRQPGVSVIYSTGYADEQRIGDLVTEGDLLLQKPYSAEQLMTAIGRCLAAKGPIGD